MKNTVKLVLGDWSHDGHGMSEVKSINCTHTLKELEKAYKLGTSKIGFDFSKYVAIDYRANILDANLVKRLRDHGLKMEFEFGEKELFGQEKEFGFVFLGKDDFCRIYLFICQLGNPKIEYIEVESDEDELYIGGYGLF